MEDRIKYVPCPMGFEGCMGLAVTKDVKMRLEQTSRGYKIITLDGEESAIGNCGNYKRCFRENWIDNKKKGLTSLSSSFPDGAMRDMENN
jgi:hypothetical protein